MQCNADKATPQNCNALKSCCSKYTSGCSRVWCIQLPACPVVLVQEKKWFHLTLTVQHMAKTRGCTRSDVIRCPNPPCSLSQEGNLTSGDLVRHRSGLFATRQIMKDRASRWRIRILDNENIILHDRDRILHDGDRKGLSATLCWKPCLHHCQHQPDILPSKCFVDISPCFKLCGFLHILMWIFACVNIWHHVTLTHL